MSIPTVEMLQKEIQSLYNFSFLKIVKIEPTNKVQSFFSERDAFNAHKTTLFISFTSLIGMEWTKAYLVDMDLSNMAQFLFIF
jgi:flagellar biosynthesis protein FlhB